MFCLSWQPPSLLISNPHAYKQYMIEKETKSFPTDVKYENIPCAHTALEIRL